MPLFGLELQSKRFKTTFLGRWRMNYLRRVQTSQIENMSFLLEGPGRWNAPSLNYFVNSSLDGVSSKAAESLFIAARFKKKQKKTLKRPRLSLVSASLTPRNATCESTPKKNVGSLHLFLIPATYTSSISSHAWNGAWISLIISFLSFLGPKSFFNKRPRLRLHVAPRSAPKSWMTAALPRVVFRPALSDVLQSVIDLLRLSRQEEGRRKPKPRKNLKSVTGADVSWATRSFLIVKATLETSSWRFSGWLARCLTVSFESGRDVEWRFGLINAGGKKGQRDFIHVE